jgi:GDP-4-dehydro-6-deoxy-D-mannose reductase
MSMNESDNFAPLVQSKRVLITGVTGFAGGYLAELLLSEKFEQIEGWSRGTNWPANLSHLQPKIPLQSIDWSNPTQLQSRLETLKPDWIFHLAGFASPGQSTRFPKEAWDANLEATRHLFDAVLHLKLSPRILYVSSGLIYGEPDHIGEMCHEATTFKPATPYAVSKCAADLLCYQYFRQFGLDVIRARPFNHTGPRQSAQYALPNFARQLAAIQLGLAEPLVETGDLSGERDLLDVRDVVNAYYLLMQRGRAGEPYNVGSGHAESMHSVLQKLIGLIGKPVEIRQKLDPNRKGDTSITVADASKLRREVGWEPKVAFSDTLQSLLNEWCQVAQTR